MVAAALSRQVAKKRSAPRKFKLPNWVSVPAIVILGFALPALTYLLMMSHLGWSAPVLGDRAQANAASAAEGSIYLYVSDANQNYYKSIGGNYDVLVKPWKQYFSSRGRRYTEVSSLNKVIVRPNSVVVMPSALAIGSDDRLALLRLQAAGVSVLSTWASGTRDANGEWMGWDFLQGLGVVSEGERERVAGSARQMTLSAESPLTMSRQAGERVWLSPSAEPILRFRSEATAARVTDWVRSVEPQYSTEGAVVYTEARSSRTVAFAFAETSWDASSIAIYDLIDDSLAWLQRQPMVALANWPSGYRAAQVVEMDTEHGFTNANAFADMLSQQQVPATFFVLTSEAVNAPGVVQRLGSSGFDIAYHGDVHTSFAGEPADVQAKRLATMRQQLAGISPQIAARAIGFRAPTEGYDQTTENLLVNMGIRYHLTGPTPSESTLPFFVKAGDNKLPLLIMPRTQRDDLNQLSLTQDPSQLLGQMVTDMDNNLRDGGLGTMSVHSQNMAPGMPLYTAMGTFLSQLSSRQRGGAIWIANGAQVDSWWRARSNVSVVGNKRGRRIELDITVKGNQPIEGVTVLLMTPVRGTTPEVRVTKVGAVVPKIRKLDDFSSQLIFPALQPGNYAYQLNFSKDSR